MSIYNPVLSRHGTDDHEVVTTDVRVLRIPTIGLDGIGAIEIVLEPGESETVKINNKTITVQRVQPS